MTVAVKQKPFIVFGYGSLIFKPPPHTIAQVSGFLKGYVRRFAQKSHDHRGTPQNPGRVVTLIRKEHWDAVSGEDPFQLDVVWGVAFTIDPTYASEVRNYLDYREKDGYTVESVDVYGVRDGKDVVILPEVMTYVGRPDNPSFLGPEPFEALAQRIWISAGPSGKNKDYLYHLAVAVRELALESHDSYLFALETRLRELDAKQFIAVSQ